MTVDDWMPFDEDGKLLLPATPYEHELWPMLLSKALIKVASLEWVTLNMLSDILITHSRSSVFLSDFSTFLLKNISNLSFQWLSEIVWLLILKLLKCSGLLKYTNLNVNIFRGKAYFHSFLHLFTHLQTIYWTKRYPFNSPAWNGFIKLLSSLF